jgi:hypothetical protein
MNWQDDLLKNLALNDKRCFLIHDPELLCYEPYIANEIEGNNVVLFDGEDPIELRLVYENWLVSQTNNALLIRYSDTDDINIPFDIKHSAKYADFHINEIINELDVNVLRLVSPDKYQFIIDAIASYRPSKLGKTDSLDFILRHLYKIAPEIIQTEVDLVRLLIRKHYLSADMPEDVEDRLITLLKLNRAFNQWDFDLLLPNKPAFFSFLQEQWQLYLYTLVETSEVQQPAWPIGKLVVPFDDQDIKVFIDNLFADGLLQSVKFDGLPSEHWAWIGVKSVDGFTDLKRYQHIYSLVKKKYVVATCDDVNADFWGELAHEVGMLNALSQQVRKRLQPGELHYLSELNMKIDDVFERWLLDKYSHLISIPSIRHPNMLHKVPDWLNIKVEDEKKVCLLVMDGMGFQQWSLIRELLNKSDRIELDEYYSFAWVPTITSISRQSLFSGKKPYFYAESLLTTSKEEQLWKAYWEDKGLDENQVIYKKKVEDKSINDDFRDLIGDRSLKVAGLVINFIDEQMHGTKGGMSGLNAAVLDWLDTWQFTDKINILLDAGFEVVITADHGNQEAIGCGALKEGVKADTKGERVRIYDTDNSASSSYDLLDGKVLKWPGKKYGLPEGNYPLVSRGTHAFVKKGKKIVGHGGISLHEVVVPLAVIKRKLWK